LGPARDGGRILPPRSRDSVNNTTSNTGPRQDYGYLPDASDERNITIAINLERPWPPPGTLLGNLVLPALQAVQAHRNAWLPGPA
jgi:hypothetical protein